MSAERLDRITAMSQRYVDAAQLAGVVTLVARDGKIVHFEAVGHRGVDDPTPLEKDDLFRIYSMSKPITAVAAMMLYEEGKFHLSDAVSEHVPELAGLEVLVDGERVPVEQEMTMRQLLTHTTGLSYGFNPNDPVDQLYREVQPLAGANLDEFAERLAQLPLAFQPGARWALQRSGGRHGPRCRAPERPIVRRLPQGTHVRTPGNGRYVLQRARRKDGSLPAEPPLGTGR